jgi:uncharacterized cysteine cluster protein YcgN (CxxCxxCC family)
MATPQPFWKTKSLAAMTSREWESLCDGCGKCCLHKLEDVDSGEILYTNAACRLLDLQSARCTRYALRKQLVPDCIQLRPADAKQFAWLPSSCAYRLVAEGRELPDWHPLVCKNSHAIHDAGSSIRGWAVSEDHVDNLEDHILPKSL